MHFKAQAVLFDNDGTLIDSTPAILRCWDTWLREFQVPAGRFDEARIFGRPAGDIAAELVPARLLAQATGRYNALEAEDPACVLLPGVRELLAGLPRERWAVVTSAVRAVAAGRLGHVGIAPDCLVTFDDVRRGKPDPEPFLLAAERLGVDPAACVVIEDAPAGIAAARAAGMRSIGVTTTHDAWQLDADIVVDSLEQLTLHTAPGGLLLEVARRAGADTVAVPA